MPTSASYTAAAAVAMATGSQACGPIANQGGTNLHISGYHMFGHLVAGLDIRGATMAWVCMYVITTSHGRYLHHGNAVVGLKHCGVRGGGVSTMLYSGGANPARSITVGW